MQYAVYVSQYLAIEITKLVFHFQNIDIYYNFGGTKLKHVSQVKSGRNPFYEKSVKLRNVFNVRFEIESNLPNFFLY